MKLSNRWLAWLLVVVYAVITSVVFGPRLDLKIVDQQFRFLRAWNGPLEVAHDPVLVGIDEQTYQQFEWPLGLWHPYFGQFLSAMATANVRGLVLDVVMPQKPPPATLTRLADEGVYNYHDDALLRGFLDLSSRNIPFVIAEATDESGGQVHRGYSEMLSVLESSGPIEKRFGMAQVERDLDGVYRRYRAEKGGRITLSANASTQLGGAENNGMINFLLGGETGYQPIQTVVDWYAQGDEAALRKHFSGKIVLLGAVTTTQDRRPMPVRIFDSTMDQSGLHQPGVMIHLQALRSYLNGGLIKTPGRWVTVLGATLILLLWWPFSRVFTLTAIVLGGTVVLYVASTLLLSNNLFVPIGSLLILLVATIFGRGLYESLQVFRERQKLKESFSGYVSPSVMTSIINGAISANTRGELRRVCVLFSDIRRFTERSENQQPEVIVSLLNRYFELMVGCIHQQGGTVDKFMGDGLMAFFGAPNHLPDPAAAAFRAALKMLERLEDLNQELLREDTTPINIGIGLHIGDVVVGHVGATGRHEYTAIGDTVNAAARLEGLSQGLKSPIIVSDAVYAEFDGATDFVDCGMQALKGRKNMRVFGYRTQVIHPTPA